MSIGHCPTSIPTAKISFRYFMKTLLSQRIVLRRCSREASSSSSSLLCARSSVSRNPAAARVQRKPHFQGKLAHSGQFDGDCDDRVLTRGSVEIWFHWERADDAFLRNFCADKPRLCCHHSQNYFSPFSGKPLKGKSGQICDHVELVHPISSQAGNNF